MKKIITDSNSTLEVIKKDVSFRLGHLTYETFLDECSVGEKCYLDIDELINAVARAYAKDVESYYIETED